MGRIFRFATLPFTNSKQNKLSLLDIVQNCVTLWKFEGQNPRPLEIPHNFFLNYPGNSTSFLIDLEFPHALFSIPLEIPCRRLLENVKRRGEWEQPPGI